MCTGLLTLSLLLYSYCCRLQTKLREGNAFTTVCLFTGGGGVGFPACVTGKMTSRGGGGLHPGWVCLQEDLLPGVGRLPRSPGTREAGDTHPTGKLSCCKYSQCQSSEAGNY